MFLLFLLVFFFELMCVKSFVSFSISFVLLTLIKKKAPAKFPDKNCERELLMTAVWQI